MSQVFSRDLEKDVAGDTSGYFKKFLTSLLQVKFIVIVICSGGSRGGGRGARPTYFKSKLRPEGPNKIFWRPPPPFLRVWMTGPPSPLISGSGWPGPPPPLSQGLDLALIWSQARRWPFLFMKDFLFFLFLYFFLNKIIDKIGVKVRSI